MDDNELRGLKPSGQRWVKRVQRPLDILAVVFLVDLILLWSFPTGPDGFVTVLNAIVWIVWVAFAVDYCARLAMSLDRRRYVSTHKVDLLMVVLPMLRLLRVFLLLRRTLATVSTEKIAGSIVSIVVAVVVGAAFFVWRVEYDAEGATITTFREALWWALVTTTTVGYGDYSPVTEAGRAIASVVMIAGIGLIGTVSATVAAWFVTRPSPADAGATQDEDPVGGTELSQQDLVTRLDALSAQQDQIRLLLTHLEPSTKKK